MGYTVCVKKKVEVEAETVALSDLVTDPENANEGSERGSALIKESMDKFGFLSPGVLDVNNVAIIGNKRMEAAEALDMGEVLIVETDGTKPVYVRRTDLDLKSDDPAVRARTRGAAYYDNWAGFQSIRLNPIQVEADLADPVLAPTLSAMMTHRERIRLGVQLDKPTDLSVGDTPTPPAEAQKIFNVQPGDIWRLGRHTLACGDSTDSQLLRPLLGAPASLLVTSPPYGVGKDYEEGGIEEWRDLIARSLLSWSTVPINTVAINLGDKHTGNDGWEAHTFGELVTMAAANGYGHLNTRIWVKQPVWSQTPYWHSSFKTVDEFEYIVVFAQKKPSYKPRLTDTENNEWGFRSVWPMASVLSNDIHTAMFPIELPMRLIRLHTDEDDLVFEPFSGSGTTIIAAEAMRRTCVAVELLPEYCAVALKRFREVTDIEPERISTAEDV